MSIMNMMNIMKIMKIINIMNIMNIIHEEHYFRMVSLSSIFYNVQCKLGRSEWFTYVKQGSRLLLNLASDMARAPSMPQLAHFITGAKTVGL